MRTQHARQSCVLLWACLGLVVSASAASAETPDRDKAWDALIAAAKARGAEETKLDRSASYVFQRPDGSFLTFTRLLATDKGRSVCLVSQEETATACVDWDTGKLKLGKRADAATPWKFFAFESLDAFEAAQPGLLDRLASGVNWLFESGSRKGMFFGNGCYRFSRNGNWYRVPKPNC